jgi:FkbM family methyltransferase
LVGKIGEVHSFEPDPKNFNILKKAAKHFKNIYLNQTAVGNKNGHIELYVSSTLNTDHQTFNIGESRKSIRVPLTSLDRYFPKNVKVKLVKIDIQGYDYYALQGMKNTLSRSKKLALVGELWPYAIKRSGINPIDYIKLVRKLGFKFIEPKKISNAEILNEVDNPYYSLDFIATKP